MGNEYHPVESCRLFLLEQQDKLKHALVYRTETAGTELSYTEGAVLYTWHFKYKIMCLTLTVQGSTQSVQTSAAVD